MLHSRIEASGCHYPHSFNVLQLRTGLAVAHRCKVKNGAPEESPVLA